MAQNIFAGILTVVSVLTALWCWWYEHKGKEHEQEENNI